MFLIGRAAIILCLWSALAFAQYADENTTPLVDLTTQTGVSLLNERLRVLSDRISNIDSTIYPVAGTAGEIATAGGTLLQKVGTVFSVREGTLTNGMVCTFSTVSGLVCNTTPTFAGGANRQFQYNDNGTLNGSVAASLNSDSSIYLGNNVGIGTSTQTHKLQVNGDASIISDQSIYLDGTDSFLKYNSSSQYFELVTDGVKRIEF